MLRLAGQFDTKEWFISLAEQNWMNLAPLREYFFGRTGLSFGRKKLFAPPKKCPRNAYACHFVTHIHPNIRTYRAAIAAKTTIIENKKKRPRKKFG